MDKNFHPDRGARAWPDGCPCCGEVVTEYGPSTAEHVEYWRFGCGCELVVEDGSTMPEINDDCPEAMNQHLEGLVIHDTDEAA